MLVKSSKYFHEIITESETRQTTSRRFNASLAMAKIDGKKNGHSNVTIDS